MGESEELPPGLYERLVTEGLDQRLGGLDDRYVVRGELHRAEAPDRIALHLSRQIARALEGVHERDRVRVGVEVVRELLGRLEALAGADVAGESLVAPGEVLRAVTSPMPDGTPRAIDAPLIPLLDTTLLTNAPSEPRIGHQVRAELASAADVDVVMAFIRSTGIRPMLEALGDVAERGGRLRVLTTTYTGSTERAALDALVAAGADVRVSYDLSTTRLHAKAWLFHRPAGYSTAYIGSSNLTHSAQVTGLEWNVRVSGARNPDVIDKVRAVFDSYWEGTEFVPYDPAEFDDHMASQRRPDGPAVLLSPVAVSPLPFQARLLEQLAVSRRRGHHRNLLVAATGTGKTVMSALDYARLRDELPRARLLFVAHRAEILDQAQATFRHVLRDASFGEQWTGRDRPSRFEHVFASVQTLRNVDLGLLDPAHFDVVVVDEFHHAAASSYASLLEHLRPLELLGLTATPERADGLSVLGWFDGRIAAELRLWDAIDQQYLTPFAYFGLHDGTDLRDVPWRRGTGYDVDALTNVYTSTERWAELVVKEFVDRVADVASVRALGFCVSVAHAEFMADVFRRHGLASVAVSASTPTDERQAALRDLADGTVQVVFSVDLFNEGVDVPSVDALLMLRPTESPTLFLQQLGRGLRKDTGKTVCTVLDFVGHHRREFRFDRKLATLLGGTRKDVADQVAARFPYLPAGCHMELDPVAEGIVLSSIRSAIPSRWPQKVDELRGLVASGRAATLGSYLEHTGLDVADVYQGGRSFSDLCEAAGVALLPAGPAEAALRRAVGRLLHVDDDVRLAGYRNVLSLDGAPDVDGLDERDRRGVRMLVAQLLDQVDRSVLPRDATLQDGVDLVWTHPQVRAEVVQLLGVLDDLVDHVHEPLPGWADVPLQVHARYSRLEILAAFGQGDGPRAASWQSGVLEVDGTDDVPDGTDLLAVTLDKTGGGFSPTTRYRDYAISRDLFHWESQAATRADSATGLRYQRPDRPVVLFARLTDADRAFWCLGPATYVRHEGERPMAITWRLQFPLPGDLFAQFAAAVA